MRKQSITIHLTRDKSRGGFLRHSLLVRSKAARLFFPQMCIRPNIDEPFVLVNRVGLGVVVFPHTPGNSDKSTISFLTNF